MPEFNMIEDAPYFALCVNAEGVVKIILDEANQADAIEATICTLTGCAPYDFDQRMLNIPQIIRGWKITLFQWTNALEELNNDPEVNEPVDVTSFVKWETN